jgi:hypothetical protein
MQTSDLIAQIQQLATEHDALAAAAANWQDLLAQIQQLATEHDALAAAAANWQDLLALTSELGYGPRLTPAQIAELLPNVHGFRELIAATQEVGPAQSAGAKFPRRKLTPEDERTIMAWRRAGGELEQVAKDRNLSLKAVVAFVESDS